MTRPQEKDYTSYVAYTRALEAALDAADVEVERLKAERERNLDSICVGNNIINSLKAENKQLRNALYLSADALEIYGAQAPAVKETLDAARAALGEKK